MTPIREEEVEHDTMPANTDAPDLKEEADVNINMAVNAAPELKEEADASVNIAINATALVGEEEAMNSSSASTVVPNHEEAELSSDTIVIGYFFQVPYVKWHPNLEMMSKAGLTQGQYERKVLSEGYVDCFACRLRIPNSTSSQHHVELAMHVRRASFIFSLSCSLTRSTWSSLVVHVQTHSLTSCHYLAYICKECGRLVLVGEQ